MIMHTTSGRWRLGLALSLNTAILWGILPIALKVLLESLDAYTITWFRYLVAALMLSAFVLRKKRRWEKLTMKNSVMFLLIAASVALSLNYITYLIGLNYLSPGTATVVIQLAPVFLLIGSLTIFKERFSALQWGGFGLLLCGMLLFFNDRLQELVSQFSSYTAGVMLIVVSAVFWAIYALSQKQLLRTFPSDAIMLCVYSAGALIFFPLAEPSSLTQLNTGHFVLLLFCAVNTLLAYGSFAEALNHWEASRISMVLATIPLITLAGVKISSLVFPYHVTPENLNVLSITGAFLVVAGSVLCTINIEN